MYLRLFFFTSLKYISVICLCFSARPPSEIYDFQAPFFNSRINIAFRIFFLMFMNHSTKYTQVYGNFVIICTFSWIYLLLCHLNLGGKINVFFLMKRLQI